MADIYYWDACVFLSYLNGMAQRVPVIDDFFLRARKENCKIVTSTWSITEVAFEATENGSHVLDPQIERRIDAFWADRRAIKLVEVHELLQREARRLMRESIPRGWSLKPIDALHLATAISPNVNATEFHTYDKSLMKYQALIGIPICEPRLTQGLLFPSPSFPLLLDQSSVNSSQTDSDHLCLQTLLLHYVHQSEQG